jgi:hypothetical protein
MLSKLIAEDLSSNRSKPASIEQYRPLADPSGPVEIAYEIESKQDRRVRISGGSVSAVGTVDQRGLFEKLVTRAGTSSYARERLLLRE